METKGRREISRWDADEQVSKVVEYKWNQVDANAESEDYDSEEDQNNSEDDN